ncbi:flavodoxin [Weissella minor]|uniref:flavodoxin n=1 Tax=Weissella minor TaxID=1620 RepID=UPI003AF216BB
MHKDNILVVYYSRTGNTEAVAELIHDKLGGDIAKIVTSEDRPENYHQEVEQNQLEQENNVLPRLNTHFSNLKKYNTVFIGFPTWNMALPQAVVSFLTTHDFEGITIVPFNTNGGYGQGRTFNQISALAPDANVKVGFSVQGGEENRGQILNIKKERKTEVLQQLTEWLRELVVQNEK